MRLIVLINAFNEALHIEKCIKSVHDYVDEIWLFDGAYKQYPNTKPYSTDGMIEKASKFPKVKIFGNNNKLWESQIVKRTAMFEQGQEGDVFFVLDGDEYCTNPEILRDHLDCDVGWVWSLCNLYRYPYMKARIFKYQKGIHYAGRHHWLYDTHDNFITSDQRMNLRFKHIDTPIRIFNYRDSSLPERLEDKKSFLKTRSVGELKYQNELQVYGKTAVRVVSHNRRAGSPCRPSEIIKYSSDIDYTFTLMFSRPWAVDRYFENLKKIKIPPKTEIICVIDTNDYEFVDNVVDMLKTTKFDSIRYIVTGNEKLEEFKDVSFRRQRIIDNWHILLTEARGDIILASEDDSLPQPDAYIRLIKDLKDNKAHFVQGNIIGRWKANMYPAWKVIEKAGLPWKVMSGEEKKGLESIQGVGWYCFAAYTDVCRKFSMDNDRVMPLGPDVSFGYRLWKAGFKLLHDWDIKVEHFGENFSLVIGRDKTKVFTWCRSGNNWISV
jgi:hypothetical protein